MSSLLTTETVPCKYCGNETQCVSTKVCNNCWEVEHRLPSFLKSEKGREFVVALLEKQLGLTRR